MCYSPSEAQADEYDAVRDMLCPKCVILLDEKDNTPLDDYNFCEECRTKINKYFEEKYK